MKKFIKGTFELDKDVTDLESYENKKKNRIQEIFDWADSFGVALNVGTADDNTYLCEYRITAKTKAMCNGLKRELKEMLKDSFPYVKSLLEISGDCW